MTPNLGGSSLTAPLILAFLAVYLVGLFVIAWQADGRPSASGGAARRFSPVIYSLSLAVYCTSWTYYGAVGTAAREGWDYLPIYLGPILALTIFFPVWRRIALATKRENAGSIADFLASRYGKSRPLGMLVALVAVVGALPYIALQLKSLSMSWAVVSGQSTASPLAVAFIASVLAGFAILFGARRPTLTAHSRGLVRAIAVESVVKLAALSTVAVLSIAALLAVANIGDWPGHLGDLARAPTIDASFLNTTFLAFAAVFCLPRQFHVGFVELENAQDIRAARWMFPLYLLLTSLAVPFILAAGSLVLQSPGNDPDIYVLSVSSELGGPIVTALVFLGGFSAAAAMVTVETVALSAMVSNELVLPILPKARWRSDRETDVSRAIVAIRRVAICLILLLAWLYFRQMNRSEGLAQIGLTSFVAAAQLLPSLVGAVFWRRGHALGAIGGIVAGTLIWFLTVAGPQLVADAELSHWLNAFLPPGTQGAGLLLGSLLSLSLNTVLYVGISLATPPKLIDRIQAAAFIDAISPEISRAQPRTLRGTISDLKALVAQFVGTTDAARAFEDLGRLTGRRPRDSDPVDPAFARAAERMLAGAIGASSARSVIGWALSGGEGRELADVVHILDEAAQAVHFNRELLQATLDNLGQGVSVVDAELRLVAWNARYLELFDLPASFVYVGKPIAEILRFNAARYGNGQESEEAFVERRLAHIRRRTLHTYERQRPDGVVLKSMGAPMPNGGYVTSFTDITELRTAATALRLANEQLEQRVSQRTIELTEANNALAAVNDALAEANVVVERASRSQSRFLAAASHDLLQPLHAARLFIGAVRERSGDTDLTSRGFIDDADHSIDSADRLLKSLLNLARLEAGGVKPDVAPVKVLDLFRELGREFQPLAAAKGLEFRIAETSLWVLSDRDLLRSVLQNLVGNAVRYTDQGGVLLGCRRFNGAVEFQVRDTGPGIDDAIQSRVFEEFYRAPGAPERRGGTGLGLAIVERVCGLLGLELSLRSKVGAGSMFSIRVPRTSPVHQPSQRLSLGDFPAGLRVLCVENDELILHGMVALLSLWGVQVSDAATAEEAHGLTGTWDVILADYQLDGEETGLDLLRKMLHRARAFALVTANVSDSLVADASAMGVRIIRKPVPPASLRAFLSQLQPAVG